MAVVYNSNQVKYGGRGYLDAKMQPVANLAALQALDSLELIEGMTVVVLDDGSGQPHDYWYIGGEWVKKSSGGGDVSELEREVAEISGNVETIETTLADKVDKESGKGLSSNDFTNELKSKLDSIEEGAERNVKANWSENDPESDAYIENKPDLSNFASKDELRTELDETLDAAADYTDSAITEASQTTLNAAKAYADEKTEDLAGSGLAYNEGKLDVQVDGTSIVINGNGKLHVVGGGGTGGTQYEAGNYIDITGDVISVTGITPDEYATKAEVAEQIADTRQGAFIAATAWTANQGYAYEEDVVDTAVDLLNRISASTSATTELINQTSSALTQSIEEEKSRAEQAEAGLLEAINDEQARAVSAETDIENSIQEAVQVESERAQGAESDLLDAVNAEKTRAQETESGLRQLVDEETERATLAEAILDDAIDQEVSRATSAESQLTQSVNAATSAITDVRSELTTEVARLEREIASAATKPVLTQDLTAAITVGGVSAGTEFTAGTSIESILVMLFGNGSTGEPTTYKFAYYGSVDNSERMYEDNPLPEEEFNEQNIKSRMTKSITPAAPGEEFEFTVVANDNQIVVAIPATLSINSATDITNNINYTSLEDGIVNLTIDYEPYKAYYYDSDAGFGQFRMKITLKNA